LFLFILAYLSLFCSGVLCENVLEKFLDLSNSFSSDHFDLSSAIESPADLIGMLYLFNQFLILFEVQSNIFAISSDVNS
jgi:hypothetical protein